MYWLELLLLASVILGVIARLFMFERHEPDPHCKLCKGTGFIDTHYTLFNHPDPHHYTDHSVCTCWHSVRERKKSESTQTHVKCLRTKKCQETEGFAGTEHEGLDMCEDGCVWYVAFSRNKNKLRNH
jgi:hypothetical protein